MNTFSGSHGKTHETQEIHETRFFDFGFVGFFKQICFARGIFKSHK